MMVQLVGPHDRLAVSMEDRRIHPARATEEPTLQDRPCDTLAEGFLGMGLAKGVSLLKGSIESPEGIRLIRLIAPSPGSPPIMGRVEQGPSDAAASPALAAHREDQGLELFGC